MNTSIQIFNYNATSITMKKENGDVMVNATQMAKAFGKRPSDFLVLPATNELIKAVTRKSGIGENQLVITERGGTAGGGNTWMNRLIALSFAQWLSIDFHLVCLEKIEELLTTGVTTVSDDDAVIAHAMQVLQRRLDASAQRAQILEGENELLTNEVKQLAPKAEYTDKVLQSTSTHTTTQVAKELGMSAIALERKLHANGIIFRQSGQWLLYAKYQDKGYVKPRTHYYPKPDGTTGANTITVWTEAGRKFVHQLFDGGKSEKGGAL